MCSLAAGSNSQVLRGARGAGRGGGKWAVRGDERARGRGRATPPRRSVSANRPHPLVRRASLRRRAWFLALMAGLCQTPRTSVGRNAAAPSLARSCDIAVAAQR